MPDTVPTTGAWQADPTIQAYLARMKARGPANRGSVAAGDPQRQADDLAFSRYIEANRQRLGIPDNYWPDPRTNGQTLYDPNQNQLRDALFTGGAMAAGGYGLGQLLGPGAAAAESATAPALGNVNATVDSLMAGGAGAGASAIDKIRKSLTDPSAYAALAPLLASLAMGSGGGNGSGGGSDELRRIQGITEARMRRVDPLHQVATQLAYSRAPIAARNGISLSNVPLPE